MPLPRLIEPEYATAALTAGGLAPSAAQAAVIPGLCDSASQLTRRYCGRGFTARTIDALYRVDPGEPLILDEWPVQNIARLACNPTPALTVTCTDGNAVRASASLEYSGDPDTTFPISAVSLTNWSAGARSTTLVPVFSGQSLTTLAASISAVSGWSASASPGYGGWPADDLSPIQGSLPAMGNNGPAEFLVHADDIPHRLDRESGIVTLLTSPSDPFNTPRFGPYLETSFGDQSIRGGELGVRCQYTAGYTATPPDLLDVLANLIQLMLGRLKTEGVLTMEKVGDYQWQARGIIDALPAFAAQTLATYRNTRS